MRPVCFKCKQEMACSKTGFNVTHDNRVWSGDQFTCWSCGNVVVINFGSPHIVDDTTVLPTDNTIELGGSNVSGTEKTDRSGDEGRAG